MPLKILFSKCSMHVPFMWQTKFCTQHKLTRICPTIEAASSSYLESVFGSNQKHEATIDTLPAEGIKFHCLLHSFTADNCKILLLLGHTRFLPNSFQLFLFSSFQTLYWMLPFNSDIQKFSIWQIIHYPPPPCHLKLYTSTTKSVEEQTFFSL
jgi:hypothetical protein